MLTRQSPQIAADSMNEFAEYITREVTRRTNDSGRELARRANFQHTTLQQWMKGATKEPNWHNVGAFADVLGVDREWLRRLAGYVDAESPAYEGDPELTELGSIYRGLPEFDRRALLRQARALRDSPETQE